MILFFETFITVLLLLTAIKISKSYIRYCLSYKNLFITHFFIFEICPVFETFGVLKWCINLPHPVNKNRGKNQKNTN